MRKSEITVFLRKMMKLDLLDILKKTHIARPFMVIPTRNRNV